MKKVYVVDDDKNIIESISVVLESEGYEVASQIDENNVVQNAKNFGADLLILDVMFPESESAGFEVARTFKKDDSTKNIPIIMLSAINEKGIYAGKFTNRDLDDMWLPVSEFLEKPINPKTLVQKVEMLLNK